MQRRKFLATVGSLAAGSAAAIGTGAFTEMSAARTVSVGVESDDGAQVALEANPNLDDIYQNSNGELELDLTGSGGEGVNINSTYMWGDLENHESQYAFKITNEDSQSYDIKAYHEFTSTSPPEDNTAYGEDWHPSYIQYYFFDGDGSWEFNSQPWEYSKAFPDGDNKSGSDDPFTKFPKPKSYAVNPGESVYVVVKVDTTGEHAMQDDDLSGNMTIEMHQHE